MEGPAGGRRAGSGSGRRGGDQVNINEDAGGRRGPVRTGISEGKPARAGGRPGAAEGRSYFIWLGRFHGCLRVPIRARVSPSLVDLIPRLCRVVGNLKPG